MANGPFINEFAIETSIHRRFSIAMFDYQKVYRSYFRPDMTLLPCSNEVLQSCAAEMHQFSAVKSSYVKSHPLLCAAMTLTPYDDWQV